MEELTQRQQEIVDESIKIISQKGVQQLTIKNIAKSMRFSEPAIYRHFKNKMDIMVGIILTFKKNSVVLLQQVEESDASALSKIEGIYRNTLQQFTKTPELTAILFSEDTFKNEEILSKVVVSLMNRHYDLVTSIIEEGQERGEINKNASADMLTLMVIGSLRLLVTRWKISKFYFSLVEKGDELMETFKIILHN